MFSTQMFPFLSFSQEVRPQRFREIQTWVVFFRSMVLSNMDSLQIPLHVSISFLEDLKYEIRLVYVEGRITIIRHSAYMEQKLNEIETLTYMVVHVLYSNLFGHPRMQCASTSGYAACGTFTAER